MLMYDKPISPANISKNNMTNPKEIGMIKLSSLFRSSEHDSAIVDTIAAKKPAI